MSCTDVQNKYPGDGSTFDFTIGFEYMVQSDVKVALWDTTTRWSLLQVSECYYHSVCR